MGCHYYGRRAPATRATTAVSVDTPVAAPSPPPPVRAVPRVALRSAPADVAATGLAAAQRMAPPAYSPRVMREQR
jgi:hypothetical protein